MDSKQAAMSARDLLLRIKNVYPFYGIGELAVLDAETLKQLSHLRLELRKAEMSAVPSVETDRLWNELRVLVSRTPSVC